MGSAHGPTEVNIRPKFRENPPRGKGDTKFKAQTHDLEL